MNLTDLKHYTNLRKQSRANTVFRFNKRNIEIMRYTDEFSIVGNKQSCNRGRKWKLNEDGVLVKKDKNDIRATEQNLRLCRKKNLKRALDNFLNYGQNNEWQYFFTMTFDPSQVDSTSAESIKYEWQLFRQKLQYYYPDIQLMCVVEYHSDGEKFHLHGVIGNADIDDILARAVNQQRYRKDRQGNILYKDGKPVRNEYYTKRLVTDIGDKVYNFLPSVYDKGFCSIIPLTDRTGDLTVYERIVFYLAKYMNKNKSAVPYGGKSYFATKNLDKGKRISLGMSDEEFEDFVSSQENLVTKKQNENFTSFVLSTTNTDEIVNKIKDVWQWKPNITIDAMRKRIDKILLRELPGDEAEEVDRIFAED